MSTGGGPRREPVIETERLVLRRWEDADRAPFAAINADPEVMRHLGPLLDRAQSDALIDRIEAGFDDVGFGLWAVEVCDEPDIVGFVGLSRPRFEAPFTPCVEVGWRLARSAWGRGYATEAARAALRHGFEVVGLDEIVSFTTVANERSKAVMRRLGMTRDLADDFEHPNVAVGDPLRPHVLYRLARSAWATRQHER